MKTIDDIFKEFSGSLTHDFRGQFGRFYASQNSDSSTRIVDIEGGKKVVTEDGVIECVASDDIEKWLATREEKLKASLKTLLASHEDREEEKVITCCEKCLGYARSNEDLHTYDIPICRNSSCECHIKLVAKETHPSPEPQGKFCANDECDGEGIEKVQGGHIHTELSGEMCECGHPQESHMNRAGKRNTKCEQCSCERFAPQKTKRIHNETITS